MSIKKVVLMQVLMFIGSITSVPLTFLINYIFPYEISFLANAFLVLTWVGLLMTYIYPKFNKTILEHLEHMSNNVKHLIATVAIYFIFLGGAISLRKCVFKYFDSFLFSCLIISVIVVIITYLFYRVIISQLKEKKLKDVV